MDSYSDEIDLREYIGVLWRWRLFIAAITLIATLTAGLVSFFVLKPVYQATTQIMVPQTPLPAEIIESPHFMQLIIEGLNLHERYDPFSLARAISLETSKASASLTTIRVENEDPALAAQIANTIAEEFLKFAKNKHEESMSSSVSYFAAQKTETESLLRTVRKDLADLKQSSRVEALQAEVNRLASQTASYHGQATAGKVREQELLTGIQELSAALEVTPMMVSGPPDWSGHPTEIPNETYQRLNESFILKRVELAEIQTRLMEITTTLTALKTQYDAVYINLLDSQNEIQELTAQEAILSSQIASFTDRINQLTSNIPETNIVSPAVDPIDPVKPQKVLNMVVAAVLGGFLSVLMVFAIEYWRSPRKSATLAQ